MSILSLFIAVSKLRNGPEKSGQQSPSERFTGVVFRFLFGSWVVHCRRCVGSSLIFVGILRLYFGV